MDRFFIVFFLVAGLTFGLTACVTQYGDNSLTGGVRVVQIDDLTLEITGTGNRYTSSEVVADHVFLRAAEETLKRGYVYFQVLDENNKTTAQAVTLAPISTGSTSSSSTTKDGVIIHSYTVYEDTTMGQTFTVERATSRIVIRLYGEIISDNPAGNIYSASELLAELGPKYLH